MKKNILLPLLLLSMLCSSSISTNNEVEFVCNLENGKAFNLTKLKENNQEPSYSNIYVQYGKSDEGFDLLRFATALKGSVKKVEYSFNGESKEVNTIYEGLLANDKVMYYSGTEVTDDEQYKGEYYWACCVLKFKSEKQVNTNYTINFLATNEDGTTKELSRTANVGDLKHKGYSIVNQRHNNTNITSDTLGVSITNPAFDQYRDESNYDPFANIVLENGKTYQGDYVVSSDMLILDASYPLIKNYFAGLCFYYENDDNFLVAYANYNTEHENTLRSVEITGILNGSFAGWHTFWTHDSIDASKVDPSKNINLSIKKLGSNFYPTINGIEIYGYENGRTVSYADFSSFNIDFNKEVKVGYYANTSIDEVTIKFSNLQIVKSSPYYTNGTGVSYTYNDDKHIVTSQSNWMTGNFVLKDDDNLIGDYSLSTTMFSDLKYNNSYEYHMGIVCFYYDSDNYLMAFAQYSNDKVDGMRTIQLHGKINGVETTWIETWMTTVDGSLIKPNEEHKIEVEKLGKTFTVKYYDTNGKAYVLSKDFSSMDSNDVLSKKSKTGFYTNTNNGTINVTYSDIIVSKDLDRYSTNDSSKINYTKNGNKYIVTSQSNWMTGNFVLKDDDNLVGDYSLSTTMFSDLKYNNSYEYHMGIVCFYYDSDNYLMAFAQYSNDKVDGMRTIQLHGKINGVETTWIETWMTTVDGSLIKPNEEHKIEVEKLGKTFTVKYYDTNGKAYVLSKDFSSMDSNDVLSKKSKTGFYTNTNNGTINVTYSDIIVSK